MATDGDKIAAATLVAVYLPQYWTSSTNLRSDAGARQQLIQDVATFYREMLRSIEAAGQP